MRCVICKGPSHIIVFPSRSTLTAGRLLTAARPKSCCDWRRTATLPAVIGPQHCARSRAFIQSQPRKVLLRKTDAKEMAELRQPCVGEYLRYGASPMEREEQKGTCRPGSAVWIVFRPCELLRTEPRQRVHVSAVSRKIRLFLSNSS